MKVRLNYNTSDVPQRFRYDIIVEKGSKEHENAIMHNRMKDVRGGVKVEITEIPDN